MSPSIDWGDIKMKAQQDSDFEVQVPQKWPAECYVESISNVYSLLVNIYITTEQFSFLLTEIQGFQKPISYKLNIEFAN